MRLPAIAQRPPTNQGTARAALTSPGTNLVQIHVDDKELFKFIILFILLDCFCVS